MELRKIIREEIENVAREIIRETIEEIALEPHDSEGKAYYPKGHKTIQDRYRGWKKKRGQEKNQDAELEENDDVMDDEELEECDTK